MAVRKLVGLSIPKRPGTRWGWMQAALATDK